MQVNRQTPPVFMILYDLDALGGAEQQAWRLAQALHQRQIRVEIVTGCWNGQKPGCRIRQGIPVHYIATVGHLVKWRGGRRLSRYVMLMALFHFLWRHRKQYQILHFHESEFLVVAGILISRLCDKRVITKMRASGRWSDLQHIQNHWRGLEKPVIIGMLKQADRTISLNEESDRELLAAGFRPERVIRMRNGIEVEKFPVREDYTLGHPSTLLFMGRLEPQKDVPTLLRSLTLLKRADTQLVVLGSGPQRQQLEGLAEEWQIKERVKFCGRVAEVVPFLQRADLFVLPSLSEGISNALLEAMACGLPCVVSDIPGNRAVVTDGLDACLFPPGNAEALAQVLTTLLDDQSLRWRLGQAARSTVARCFSMQAVTEAYLTLYRQLSAG